MKAPNLCMSFALGAFVAWTALCAPACTSVASAENGALTVEQYACMTADLAEEITTGDVQVVAQDLATVCKVAPALLTTVEEIVNAFAANKAALEAKRLAGEPPPVSGMWISIAPSSSSAAPAHTLH